MLCYNDNYKITSTYKIVQDQTQTQSQIQITFYIGFDESINFYNLLVKDCAHLIFDDECDNETILPFPTVSHCDCQYLVHKKPCFLIKSLRSLNIPCFHCPTLILSKNIQHLTIGFYFSKPIITSKKLRHLYMRSYYHEHNTTLGKLITNVVFSQAFNQNVNLSKNITHLEIGRDFSKPLVLPKNMKNLVLSYGFNHHIILPKHMIFMSLSQNYHQYLIYDNLKEININCANGFIIDNVPNKMKSVYLGIHSHTMMCNVPNDLKILMRTALYSRYGIIGNKSKHTCVR